MHGGYVLVLKPSTVQQPVPRNNGPGTDGAPSAPIGGGCEWSRSVTLNGFEAGENVPTLTTAMAITTVLGVPLEKVFSLKVKTRDAL